MGRGQTLRSLLSRVDPCRKQPGCPDQAWMAQHQVALTRQPVYSVDRLNLLDGEIAGGHGTKIHQATIVLVDQHGVRTSDAAWTVEFLVRR
jgi:hypothetical protein